MRQYMNVKIAVIVLFVVSVILAGVGDVDYNSGQLAFSKTLVKARGHKLTLPVNLNYNSRLVKGQRSSWVGMGFQCDLPYIERTVVGGADERSGYSFDYSTLEQTKINQLKSTYAYNSFLAFDFFNYKPLVSLERTIACGDWACNSVVDWHYTNSYHKTAKTGIINFPVDQNGCVTILKDCEALNNQTQQDNYALHNFPGGDRRIFFAQGEIISSIPNAEIGTVSNIILSPCPAKHESIMQAFHIISWPELSTTCYCFEMMLIGHIIYPI